MALSKLGHTVLFLSTRISIAAYNSLLQATGAKHLLVSSAFKDVAGEVKNSSEGVEVLEISSSDVFDFPILDNPDTCMSQHLRSDIETKRHTWIIHSSGSTGLPKPIYQTHDAALKNYANNLDMRGFITLPLYHAHGKLAPKLVAALF